MPVVFRQNGFRFHFFSDEGDPREPIHIHVSKPGADAKFWLYPEVIIAYNRGLQCQDLQCAQQNCSGAYSANRGRME